MFKRETCPVCSTANVRAILELPFRIPLFSRWMQETPFAEELAKEQYVAMQCADCGLYFQKLVCDARESLRLYNRSNEESRAQRKITTEAKAGLAEEALLVRLLIPEPHPRVFDFGMGMGWWAGMMRGFDCEAWGSDILPQSAECAGERGIKFIEPADSLPDGYFDFVNADQVFEHLASPLETIQRLAACLKPGGYLKISTPGDRNFAAKLGQLSGGKYDEKAFQRDFEVFWPLHHINLFARTSLHALALRAGLRPFRVPLKTSYSTMTLFSSAKQWNRNLYRPIKRWRAAGTWQYFVKPR